MTDVKWASYKTTTASIFFAQVHPTHRQRRHRSTIDWRRNILHYYAGMEASAIRASHMMSRSALCRLRKMNHSEVMMLLVVELLVTVCEYFMNKAKDPRVYSNWNSTMKDASDAIKQGDPPLGLRVVLKAFRLHNNSEAPLHPSLVKADNLAEKLHIDTRLAIVCTQNRRHNLLAQPSYENCHDNEYWEVECADFERMTRAQQKFSEQEQKHSDDEPDVQATAPGASDNSAGKLRMAQPF